ncbi:MAG TPA: hypothetical protein ENJ28_02810 [Gammaproteobacteria bacterium]|nr:hypothetical protein [Gammaproteobacteria bacterium]
MNETPIFFPASDYKLFGVLHMPVDRSAQEAFVFCHPFAEEKLWTHRVYVSFARELTKAGYAVLRLDCMGQGDSNGDFSDSTIESMQNDIESGIEYVKTKLDGDIKINLLGLRFGATLAALVAEKNNAINKLILWDPIVDGSRYMQEILRSNLSAQLAMDGEVSKNREQLIEEMREGKTVNYEGYDLTEKLFEQVCQINLIEENKMFKGSCCIVQISKEGRPVRKEIQSLAEIYESVDIFQADEEPFWREIKKYYGRANNLFFVTLNWLKSCTN